MLTRFMSDFIIHYKLCVIRVHSFMLLDSEYFVEWACNSSIQQLMGIWVVVTS